MSQFPEFPLDLEWLFDKAVKTIEKNKKEIKKLIKQKDKTFDSFVLPLLELEERLNFFVQPIFHLNSVKNSKKSQKYVKKILPILSQYHTEIAQNSKIYEALKAIKLNSSERLTGEQKRALELEIKRFLLEGVELCEADKKRIGEINEELSSLENQFSQNVLDDTNAYELLVDEEALGEMPQFEKNLAKFEKDGVIKYKFTLQEPSFTSFMTYASDRQKREELYKAYVTRGEKNRELITKILSLRDEKAKILGFDSFASLSLASKTASSHKEVIEFLETLAKKSKEAAKREIEELREFAKRGGVEDLQSFDTAYFSEKLRKELFDIDEERLKEYFELSSVINGMFKFLEKMFGIEFKEVKAKLWDKSAKAYDIVENGAIIARLYTDLHARKNKKGGAWMDSWQSSHIDPNGKKHLPVAFIVCNFPKATKKEPSLLKHQDIETLFHEMGHALHHLLSKNSVVSVSGVNGVLWDVIEFPSQFLEKFAYNKDVLRLFAYHYKTKEPLSDSEIEKIQKAKNFQSALAMLRQLEFGIFDMKIHSTLTDEEGAEKILEDVRKSISVLMPPSYNRFKNSFSHIFAGGYAAGYYSYKWAEVLSADAFCAFVGEDGSLKLEKARALRDTLFAKGGGEDMGEIFREFMGREVDDSALLKLNGII